MTDSPDAGGIAPSASDRLDGPFWIVLGAAIVVGSLRIDRLEAQGVEWFAAPGLLPAVLGLLIGLCGVWLSLRGWRAPAVVSAQDADAPAGGWRRIGVTLGLCLGFALLLVGRGLPFGVAAGLYLFAHISLLQWPERGARCLPVALAVAVVTGLAVPYVFEQLFLVRLP